MLKSSPCPGPWKHCPPQQWSLVPEWLGTAVSHMPHVDGVTVSAGLSQGVSTQVPPSSEPEAGAGVQKVCLGSIPPWSRGAVEGGKSSVTKVTVNMFVGKKTKTKTDIGQWESISLRHPEKGQTAYKLSPWRLKRRNVCLPAPVLQHSARPWCTRLGPGLPWHSHGADSLCVQEPHPELRWPWPCDLDPRAPRGPSGVNLSTNTPCFTTLRSSVFWVRA